MSVAVLVIVAAGFGAFALRGPSFSGVEGFVYRLYAGFAACAVVILVAGTLSLGLSQFVLVVGAAGWLAYESFVRARHLKPPAAAEAAEKFSPLEWLCIATLAGSLGFALIGALAPITGWDAAVAHAALPAEYARQGRLGAVPGIEYSGYPHLMHVLFTQAYYSGGETGLSMLNWWFALMACGAAYALGRRVQGRQCGIVSAAILATAPVFIDQTGAPGIDLPFTGYTLAALAAFAAWLDERRAEWLLAAGLFAGASCGVRHTGYLLCALLALAAIVYGRPERIRAPAWFLMTALVAAAPWLIRSALVAGNPVYPFFSGMFNAAILPHGNITALAAHESVKTVGLRDFLMFPWNIVMRPGMFDGWSKSPGGLVLILGIPGLFAGGRKARRLGAFSAAGVAAFYFFQRLARYMLPFFAPMMVVGAAGVVRLRALRFVTVPALAAVFAFGLALAAGANMFKLNAALGLEAREDYLARRVERYAAFDWINKKLPRDELLLTFDRRAYYLTGRTWPNDEPLRRLASAGPEDRLDWLRGQGIKWVLAPVTFVEESPGMRKPFRRMIAEWRDDERHFRLVQRFDLPRPHGDGRDVVEIFEVRYD